MGDNQDGFRMPERRADRGMERREEKRREENGERGVVVGPTRRRLAICASNLAFRRDVVTARRCSQHIMRDEVNDTQYLLALINEVIH